MVFLLLDGAALQETLKLALQSGGDVWLGTDSLTDSDFKQLCASGHKITRFSYSLSGASAEVLNDALATIEEHHPNQTIWVQHVAQP
jgi:hypothetical protein